MGAVVAPLTRYAIEALRRDALAAADALAKDGRGREADTVRRLVAALEKARGND